MSYTKKEIINSLEKLAGDMPHFYQDACINYRGRTADTQELYTEVIAAWLLEHLDLFERIKIIPRQASYCVAGHDGECENPASNREEEMIAMAMKRQGTLNILGRVVDYQTPLKNVQSDKAGKIDLLTYDGKTLRLLELKKPDSKETMLRCVLEGYTYLKIVEPERLRKSFEEFGVTGATPIEASPFVYHDGSQRREMQEQRPHLQRLMRALGSKPYYYKEGTGEIFQVKEE